jgi:glycosyltransferase involved in cell wall biosynthesis
VRKPRLLILIVAYNAEKTISPVLARVPHQLAEEYDVEVLVLDDSSQDQTFERSRDAQREGTMPFPLHVLFNPVNQGYGGALRSGFGAARYPLVCFTDGDRQFRVADLASACAVA